MASIKRLPAPQLTEPESMVVVTVASDQGGTLTYDRRRALSSIVRVYIAHGEQLQVQPWNDIFEEYLYDILVKVGQKFRGA